MTAGADRQSPALDAQGRVAFPGTDLTVRQARGWLAAILLLGAAARVYLTLCQPELGANLFSDDNAYLNAGAVFARTGYVTYARPDTQSAVLGAGMPLLLGLLFTVFGYGAAGLLWSHLSFSMIGLGTAVGAYLLVSRLRTRRAGLLAAALTALEPQLLSAGGVFYTETPYLCLNLLTLYFFLRAAQEDHMPSLLAGTACLCAAAAFKGLALLAPLIALPVLWRRRVPPRVWLPRAGAVAALFAVMFLPWCVRNQLTVGSFTPFPLSQGDQKLLGTYVGLGCPPGTYDEDVTGLDAEAWAEGYQADVYARLARRGELAQARLTQWWQQNPVGLVVTQLVYKPGTLLLEPFYPDPLPGVPARAVRYAWWGLIALAVWGLGGDRLLGARNKPGFALPALYLLAALLMTAAYVPLSRYNAPHIPLVLCYAAIGLESLWLRLRPGRRTAVKRDAPPAPETKEAKARGKQ